MRNLIIIYVQNALFCDSRESDKDLPQGHWIMGCLSKENGGLSVTTGK